MMSSSSSVIEKLDAAISWLSSSDAKVVSKGLNFLLAKSVDGFENSAHIAVVAAECCPKLIIALGDLMDVVNPLGTLLYKPSSVDEDYFSIILSSPKFEEQLPPSIYSPEFKFLSRYVDDNLVLLSCLTILRNISFEATSEPLLAFSTPIMRQLVSLVCLGSQSNAMAESTFLAFDILTRLAHRIDLFGKRRMQFSNQVLESLDHAGHTATKLRLAPPFAFSSATEYIMSVRLILPAVLNIIRRPGNVCELRERGLNRAIGLRTGQQSCRALVIGAMELLGRLVANPDNHTFLLRCPRLLVEGLVHLLLVSHTRGDSIVAEAQATQGDPFGRFRPPAAVLLPRLPKPLGQVHAVPVTINLSQSNLFGMDYVDSEMRDLALDLLGALCKLSRDNALGLVPSAVPYLLRLVQAMHLPEYVPLSAFTSSRPESAQKAIGLLQILVLMPESDQAFRAAKTELLLAACRDDALADLVLNKGHPAFISLVDNELQDGGGEAEISGGAPTLQTSDTALTLA